MRKELLTVRDDVFVVRDFFTPAECEHYIARSESVGFGDAPINTFAGPQVNKRMRNNERVMIDDHTIAATLWERLAPLVPAKRGSWRACGLNERFRFYRYDPGQQFDWHYDGRFERTPKLLSDLTFMVYLNDGFGGGHTEFHWSDGCIRDTDPVTAVVPEAGMALVFKHAILHRGAPVTSGRKYVLRSDMMYRWVDDESQGERPV